MHDIVRGIVEMFYKVARERVGDIHGNATIEVWFRKAAEQIWARSDPTPLLLQPPCSLPDALLQELVLVARNVLTLLAALDETKESAASVEVAFTSQPLGDEAVKRRSQQETLFAGDPLRWDVLRKAKDIGLGRVPKEYRNELADREDVCSNGQVDHTRLFERVVFDLFRYLLPHRTERLGSIRASDAVPDGQVRVATQDGGQRSVIYDAKSTSEATAVNVTRRMLDQLDRYADDWIKNGTPSLHVVLIAPAFQAKRQRPRLRANAPLRLWDVDALVDIASFFWFNEFSDGARGPDRARMIPDSVIWRMLDHPDPLTAPKVREIVRQVSERS